MRERPRQRVGCRGRILAVGLVLSAATAPPAAAVPGRFSAPVPLALQDPSFIVDATVGDLDGDGDGDVYLAYGRRTAPDGISEIALPDRVLRNDGGSLVDSGMALDAAAPRASGGVTLVDVDRDGDLDAVVATASHYLGNGQLLQSPSRVWRNQGGQLQGPFEFGVAESAIGVAASDFDADGDVDVAIARQAQFVDLYRNDTAQGASAPLQLALLQRLQVSSSALAGVRFARDGAGRSPLLLVLRTARSIPGSPPGVMVYRRNAATGQYVQGTLGVPEPPGSALDGIQLQAFDVGDFDLDGRDDVVLAVATSATLDESLSRVLRATGAGFGGQEFSDTGMRFPFARHRRVRAADADGDGRADIVLGDDGEGRCTETAFDGVDEATRQRYCVGSSLNVWLAGATGFIQSGDCLGSRRVLAFLTGRVDGDGLDDLVVARASGEASALTSRWHLHRNDGPADGAQNCCVAEVGALYGELAPLRSDAAAAVDAAAPSLDLPALAALREDLMPDSPAGQRLAQRYVQHGPEVVALLRATPARWRQLVSVLVLWTPAVRSLVDGQGDQAGVSAEMVDAVDQFLLGLSADGSPALAAVIAEERALLPPFATFVGMDMDQFLAATLPSDVLLRDGFEDGP
jgi:hypothetical protein